MAHILYSELKEDLENPDSVKAEIKTALEGLCGQIEGLLEMHILTEGFPSSAGDLMMDSLFESEDALKFYQTHPAHQAVAIGLVRPAVAQHLSFDCTI